MSENIDINESKKLLDRLLVDNSELEELNAKLAEFNIFNVLNITQNEIRHSNTLAWLLNPRVFKASLSAKMLTSESM